MILKLLATDAVIFLTSYAIIYLIDEVLGYPGKPIASVLLGLVISSAALLPILTLILIWSKL